MSANSNALNQLRLGSLKTKRLRKTTTKKWSMKFIGGNVIEENLRKGFDHIAVLVKLC